MAKRVAIAHVLVNDPHLLQCCRHWRNARAHTLYDPVCWKYFHVGNHYLNGTNPLHHP